MQKKVVVLGGNGFLGKNIVHAFSDAGYRVRVYDISPPLSPYKDVHYVTGDLWDKESLKDTIAGSDVVIHLASSCTPQSSMTNPKNAFIDIELSEDICSACVEKHVSKIIYASSGGTIYGNIGRQKAKEDMQTWPINYYAISKIAIEKTLMMYNNLKKMENIVLRISNPYGWGQSPNAKVGAISVFAHKIIADQPIHIFGDGKLIRDYVRVEDVAQAFLLAAEWDNRENILPVFNIGSGEGLTIGELPGIIAKELGKKMSVVYNSSRAFDIEYNVLDIEKAKKHLGYSLSVDSIEGVRLYLKQLIE